MFGLCSFFLYVFRVLLFRHVDMFPMYHHHWLGVWAVTVSSFAQVEMNRRFLLVFESISHGTPPVYILYFCK